MDQIQSGPSGQLPSKVGEGPQKFKTKAQMARENVGSMYKR